MAVNAPDGGSESDNFLNIMVALKGLMMVMMMMVMMMMMMMMIITIIIIITIMVMMIVITFMTMKMANEFTQINTGKHYSNTLPYDYTHAHTYTDTDIQTYAHNVQCMRKLFEFLKFHP